MSILPRDTSNSRTNGSSISNSRHPVDRLALRGSRRRAKELGILEEFWELVSAGKFATARDRLALEERRQEERARWRQASILSVLLLSVAGCVTVTWWLWLHGP
jgi:hypothetical protein